MTALPNLFATTAHDHTDRDHGRQDVFAPDDAAHEHLAAGVTDLFSTEPLGDHRPPPPTAPLVTTTESSAPPWMSELLASVDAGPPGALAGGRPTFGEEGSVDLRRTRPEAVRPVVRRRNRTRRHGVLLRRRRSPWTLTTGDATLP